LPDDYDFIDVATKLDNISSEQSNNLDNKASFSRASKVIKSDIILPKAIREHLVDSYRNGTAANFAEFMCNALPIASREAESFLREKGSLRNKLRLFIAVIQLSWDAAKHNDEENNRWCWLRAVEWINWPIFLSSSTVPLLLLCFDWQSVAVGLLLCNWAWYFLIGKHGRNVSVPLANMGALIVAAKWIICPLTAAYFYFHGQTNKAFISLLWPLFPFIVVVPVVNLFAMLIMPSAPIRPVQDRFMRALGYRGERK